MAFTSILDTDIDADSPLTTTLVTALRDNDNYLKALYDSIFTSLSAGDYEFHRNSLGNSSTSLSWIKFMETKIGIGGTLRIRFSLNGGGQTAYGRIYKNGVAFGTERSTTSQTPVEYSEDLVFAQGDLLQVYGKSSSGVFSTTIDDLAICVSAPPIAGTIAVSV